MHDIFEHLAIELSITRKQVLHAVKLLDQGNTVPFIARYRKEVTGNLDDETLRLLERSLSQLRTLEARKDEVFRLIGDKLDASLERAIVSASSLSQLEDIYRPFRPRRKTRASRAKEAGLLPLAKILQNPEASTEDFLGAWQDYQSSAYATEDKVLQGAKDIVAEALADSPQVRGKIKDLLHNEAFLVVKGRKGEALDNYQSYENFVQPIGKLKSYQVLALNRGEKEKKLQVKLETDHIDVPQVLLGFFRYASEKQPLLHNVTEDTWKRLLKPSLENEIRNSLTTMAEEDAMEVFSKNLKSYLLDNPLPGKIVMALDPGFRNGCKVAIVDVYGNVLDVYVVYPVSSQAKAEEAKRTLAQSIDRYKVEIVAIGNGTATRETEDFFTAFLEETGYELDYLIVNEAGASVYSASELASQEFPDMDVSLRSAVSLARRVQDPLAELVKVEPQALGVGQYQHDMNQKALALRLGAVVEDCVNQVGCDVNTASQALLEHIAGINTTLAKNIVQYREANGPFRSREELKQVPRLGARSFLQCAGFLRVIEGDEPLDNTFIHPETYGAVRKLLKLMDSTIEESRYFDMTVEQKKNMRDAIGLGQDTFEDVLLALAKRGLDPRDVKSIPKRSALVKDIKDVRIGMTLPGVVRNVTQFGAFVDIGVHQDGLVHISEISEQFVDDPHRFFQAGQRVDVHVIDVDVERKRISLSTKGLIEVGK